MRSYYYLLSWLTSLLISCHSANLQPLDQPPLDPTSGVALYLITSPANLGNDPGALDKARVSLSSSALINYNEIENYTPSTYTFQLKDAAAHKLKELSATIALGGKPFALVVDGTVTYYGYLWNSISSFSSIYPIIVLDQASNQNQLVVSLMKLAPGSPVVVDPRNDSRLLNRLKADNKLN